MTPEERAAEDGPAPAGSRVLALDLGDRRVGLAISDPLGFTAQPLDVWTRPAGAGPALGEDEIRRLAELVRERGVTRVVVGVPRNMNGTMGPRALAALRQVEDLRAGLPAHVAVVPWDERLSTVQAERVLVEGDLSRRRRRGVVDAVAAVLILQSWLDRHRRSGYTTS